MTEQKATKLFRFPAPDSTNKTVTPLVSTICNHTPDVLQKTTSVYKICDHYNYVLQKPTELDHFNVRHNKENITERDHNKAPHNKDKIVPHNKEKILLRPTTNPRSWDDSEISKIGSTLATHAVLAKCSETYCYLWDFAVAILALGVDVFTGYWSVVENWHTWPVEVTFILLTGFLVVLGIL
jgi:hypothetical protein